MGVYDTVRVLGRDGQVKCWGRKMRTLTVNDEVGTLHGHRDYCIAMREGGYLYVVNKRIRDWKRDLNPDVPTFDKYGQVFTPKTQGELGDVIDDPYFFR